VSFGLNRWIRDTKAAAGLAAILLLTACNGTESDSYDPQAGSAVSKEPGSGSGWTESERSLLESLSLSTLGPAPHSNSNRVADSPRAVELGHRLFFDAGLSANGRVACASCHNPALLFTDGLSTSRGIGVTHRNAPSLIGASHSSWMYWDGRRDSLWAQALAPLEAAAEMGSTRLAVVRRVTTQPATAQLYREVFGAPPELDDLSRFPERGGPFGDLNEKAAWTRMDAADRQIIDQAFANIGKAIGAYERLLQPGPSRFDRYVQTLSDEISATPNAQLSELELQGLRLFVNAERLPCLRCHNGPLFTNNSFHDVGTASTSDGLPEFGRFVGIQAVLIDPFNCLGPYSDSGPEDCGELRYLNKSHVAEETGKFKTPTLRGLIRTAPYLHDGRFGTLNEVVAHYREQATDDAQPTEITPFELSEAESRALVAFLASLDGPLAIPSRWLEPPSRDSALTLADDSNSDRSGTPPLGGSQPDTNRSKSVFTATSDRGVFDVSLWPEDGTIPMRRLHAWMVRVHDANGARVMPLRLSLDGGMRQHGHGLDSQPSVAQRLTDGDYRIEGMKFHMAGDWQLQVRIVTEGLADIANFEIYVGP
jgi:cytochrome c peroxidase